MPLLSSDFGYRVGVGFNANGQRRVIGHGRTSHPPADLGSDHGLRQNSSQDGSDRVAVEVNRILVWKQRPNIGGLVDLGDIVGSRVMITPQPIREITGA